MNGFTGSNPVRASSVLTGWTFAAAMRTSTRGEHALSDGPANENRLKTRICLEISRQRRWFRMTWLWVVILVVCAVAVFGLVARRRSGRAG
jgi:hypothetical protein